MFSVVVEKGNLDRKFDTLALRAEDLRRPLGAFGRYLRAKARAKYDAQDFEPLAASTIKKRAQAGTRQLARKLHRELSRAARRAFARAREARHDDAFERVVAGEAIERELRQAVAGSRSVQNRAAVLAEFQRRHHGHMDVSRLADLGQMRELTAKAQLRLSAREVKSVAKSVDRPILGKLRSSLVVEVGRGTVTLASRARGVPSAAHNEGAIAGHGAKLPARPTIELEADDLSVFEQQLVEHHLLPALREGNP